MSVVHVCPLSALPQTLEQSGARWMISLAGPGKSITKPDAIDGGFLGLEFNDISSPREGLLEPKQEHVDQILNFAKQWNQSGPLLIHCWMGISRSTAAALMIAAQTQPGQNMDALAQNLRHISPMATPNALMIELADDSLGLNQTLTKAVASIGRGADAYEGIPFKLDVGERR